MTKTTHKRTCEAIRLYGKPKLPTSTKTILMLTDAKMAKLSEQLKAYSKRFLSGSIIDLDESGTRIMINQFLSDVLGYTALEEIRTEYMIKGTYADYMIQINGKRHFLVEVKAFSINLNDSHLRQAVNYGANEGVEWALLTNGKQFDLYKILFSKPIASKKIFSLNLSDGTLFKKNAEMLQYLTKDSINKKGLDLLWNKAQAITPMSLSKCLLSEEIVCMVRKNVNKSFETKFTDEQIQEAIYNVIKEKIELPDFKLPKLSKKESARKKTVTEDLSIPPVLNL